MHDVSCQQCGVFFHARRSDAKFCDAACRKAASRGGISENRSTSPTEARRQDELLALHMDLCATYYGLPPADRQVYLKGLIDRARAGDAKIRRILTNWVLLRPREMKARAVHYRGTPAYPTLAQEAHEFCKWYWDAGIAYVVDHPDLAPYAERVERDRAKLQALYQRQLAKVVSSIPRIMKSPERVQLSHAMAIIASKGPVLTEEQRGKWGL